MSTQKKKKVVVEGFLLSCHSPTESRLTVKVECSQLQPMRYMDLVNDLEDQLGVVDESYAERNTQGRMLRARYRRDMTIEKIERKRFLRIIPFPSSYANRLRSMRRRLYVKVNSLCVVLQQTEHGYFKRRVYLLPFNKAPEFMIFIQSLNREIGYLNIDIEDFRGSGDFNYIEKMFKSEGLNTSQFSRGFTIPPIEVDLTPLSLDEEIITSMLEERYASMFERMSEEEKQGLQRIQRELKVKRRRLVVEAIESLRVELTEIIIDITKERRLKKMRERLRRLMEKCESVGLRALAESTVNPLISVIADPEKIDEAMMREFGVEKEKVGEAVNGRIRSLIESL